MPGQEGGNAWAGSALMKDEALPRHRRSGGRRLRAARAPVTLKMRTGWCASERNAVRIARMAETAGVAMVAVHGRTREQGYGSEAEYDTIAAVKAAVAIPVVANGDIDSPRKARAGSDEGRRDHDRPRGAGPAVDLPGEIAHYLATGEGAAAETVQGGLAHRAPARPLRPGTARPAAMRSAQAHRLGRAGSPGGAGLPRPDEPGRRRAGARSRRILRPRLADTPPRRRFARRRGANDDASRKISHSKHEQEAHRGVRPRQPGAVLQGPARRGAHGVHDMIIVVEKPLLDVVMKHAEGNQSRAADGWASTATRCAASSSDHKLIDKTP